ncbi:MAG: YncE family protein [Rhizomicrobium sp.]|jgi:DNA-binding beta-propeller fold protein YncE
MAPSRCILALIAVLAAAGSLATPAAAGDAAPVYKIVKEVPLGMPDKWDFVYFDAGRVYVSHGTEVTVIDGRSGELIGRVPGIDGSHGVVAAPSLGRGYADATNANSLVAFDLKTLKPLATMPAGEDADDVVYDPATKRVFVMDADGTAMTAVDAVQNKTISTTPLNGKPESATVDGAGNLFINSASTNEVLRVDTRSLAILSRWPVPDCQSPHGLAIDTAAHRLFVSCVNAKLQVVSSDDGHVVATLPIGKGTDTAAFDPKRKLIFSSNGEGTLSVIAERGADDFVSLGEVPTAPGARTMAVDPASGRVFLVTGEVAKTEPPTVKGRAPHFVFVPGSVKLLLLDPQT